MRRSDCGSGSTEAAQVAERVAGTAHRGGSPMAAALRFHRNGSVSTGLSRGGKMCGAAAPQISGPFVSPCFVLRPVRDWEPFADDRPAGEKPVVCPRVGVAEATGYERVRRRENDRVPFRGSGSPTFNLGRRCSSSSGTNSILIPHPPNVPTIVMNSPSVKSRPSMETKGSSTLGGIAASERIWQRTT